MDHLLGYIKTSLFVGPSAAVFPDAKHLHGLERVRVRQDKRCSGLNRVTLVFSSSTLCTACYLELVDDFESFSPVHCLHLRGRVLLLLVEW